MALFAECEECSDSIGDKLCIYCYKVFCSNCKLSHLSLEQFPSHIFHNISPVVIENIGNLEEYTSIIGVIDQPKTINSVKMGDFEIENMTHHYGDADSASVDIPIDDNSETIQKATTYEKKSPEVSKQTTKEKEVNVIETQDNTEITKKAKQDTPEINEKTKQTSEVNSHIEQDTPGVNSGVVKSPDGNKPLPKNPDNVNDTEKQKHIFELTESEIEKESTSPDKMQDPVKNKTNVRRLDSEKTAYSILEMTSTCIEHDSEFVFICDRCDIPVCKMCVVREHKGHKLSDIDETATMRENALAVVLSPRIAGAEKNSNDMENSLASFESEINAVNNSIKLHGDAIKELVDKQVSLMLINVKEKADKRKHKFIDLNESLHEAVEKGKHLQRRHHDLTQSKNDGSLILKLKKLDQEAKSFHYPSVPNIPSVKYSPPKVTEGDIETLFGSFKFM